MKRKRKGGEISLSALTAGDQGRSPATGLQAPAAAEPEPGSASARPAAPRRLNVAAYLRHLARESPDRMALDARGGAGGGASRTRMTFGELSDRAWRSSRALAAAGVRAGDRVLVAGRSTGETIELACAAWQLGASVALLGESGAGRPGGELGAALAACRPTVLVAPPRVLVAAQFTARPLETLRLRIALGTWLPAGWPSGGASFGALLSAAAATGEGELARTEPDAEALVLLTRRGERLATVVLDHAALVARVEALRDALGGAARRVAVTSTLAALAVLALGGTAVCGERRAGRSRARLADLARDGVGAAVADVETWRVLAATEQVPLTGVTAVALGAASPALLAALRRLTGAEPLALFGTAEAFPIATASGESAGESVGLAERGAGSLIGPPPRGAEVALMKVVDAFVPAWTDELARPHGDVGEIVVRGPLVARSLESDGSALQAIDDPAGAWLRTGELAWSDRDGRLWSCGAKADRVETPRGDAYPSCLEPLFEAHPGVSRAWVVGRGVRGAQEPVLVVESAEAGQESRRNHLELELLELAQRQRVSAGIRHVHVRPVPSSPSSREDAARWLAARGATSTTS